MKDIARALYAMTEPQKRSIKPPHLLTDAELEVVRQNLTQWRRETLRARAFKSKERSYLILKERINR